MIGFYGGPVFFNLGLALLAAAFGRLDLYFLLWLLPFATTYMLFLRIRNIAEHATVSDLDDPLQNSRTTLVNIVERAFMAPYWVNFHIEHHMMPFVPCYRLPEVHKILKERDYGEKMAIYKGYFSVIKLNASA